MAGKIAGRNRKPTMWRRLGRALKIGLTYDLNDIFRSHKAVDGDLLDEIEALLLSADVGVEGTERLVSGLTKRLARRQLKDGQAVRAALREDMLEILLPVSVPLQIPTDRGSTFVILMVGVNGSGKTTTIAKMASGFRKQGYSVLLGAGDTFRAAAVEQLRAWGERIGVPVVSQHPGADSASVLFDALQAARARGVDVLIADTAGRLHTHGGLMDELKKVKRVLSKQDDESPHETLLVLDAGTGQNALVQAQQFHEAVNVTGIALSKLDGTAKGGMVFAVAEKLRLPIRFVGVGEGIDDLRQFDAADFVDTLLSG